jgi:hypothetical protein
MDLAEQLPGLRPADARSHNLPAAGDEIASCDIAAASAEVRPAGNALTSRE